MAIHVTGLRETSAALREVDGDLDKALRKALKEAAEPVASDARSLIGKYRGARTTSIRPRATNRAVFVRQSAGKKTGKRPDFGALQWRKLNDALDKNEKEVRDGIEEAIDRVIHSSGL